MTLIYKLITQKILSMEEIITWLLEGPPWVHYRTRIDLLSQQENEPEVQEARQAMVEHPQIRGIISDTSSWLDVVLKSHKDAKHPIHKLALLAEFGLTKDDAGMTEIIDQILAHQSDEGPFQILVNIPTHFGGTGKDQWSWMLCDAPLLLYSLIKFGFEDDARVLSALQYLVDLIRENGWGCVAAPELGKFRGPGRKDDPCPYGNLLMLKVMAQSSALRNHIAARTGAETLLSLWDQRKERKPYLFGMGTDFAKLKAPFVWYDILHVIDVLSQFPWLRDDERLLEMVSIVEAKMDDQARFTPESVWRAWKEWDFGQKKEPAWWVTFLLWRIFSRVRDKK